MQTSNSFYITLGTGALSILVTVLSVLQVLFNYSGLSEKCKTISARYGSIRREIEALMAQKNIADNELNERLNRINAAMTNLDEDSPHIPERIHKKVKKSLSSDPIQNPLFSGNIEKKDNRHIM